jgi:hypothetical protein
MRDAPNSSAVRGACPTIINLCYVNMVQYDISGRNGQFSLPTRKDVGGVSPVRFGLECERRQSCGLIWLG